MKNLHTLLFPILCLLVFFLVSAPHALAAPFASDTFTDTDAVLLENHVPDVGTSWTKGPGLANGVLTINNNTIYSNLFPPEGLALWYIGASSATADYDVQATFYKGSSGGTTGGIAGRISISAVTAYGVRCDSTGGSGWRLSKWVNGTRTDLDTYVGDSCTTARVGRLRMRGDQISFYIDDVLRIGPITDSSISAAGRAGVYTLTADASTSRYLDNWSASDPAAAAAAAPSRVMRLFEGLRIHIVGSRLIIR